MKIKTNNLTGVVLSLLVFSITINAATQVYDLKNDWSDTQNPNGPWSYRDSTTHLVSYPFPWVGADFGTAYGVAITKNLFLSGDTEPGDVLAVPGDREVNVLWVAPGAGTINISGAMWPGHAYALCDLICGTVWRLEVNGEAVSSGLVEPPGTVQYWRNSPYYLMFGNGGPAALQNISVGSGDHVVLRLTGLPVGVNLTIELTPGSVDPATAVEEMAATVMEMNLQNGIVNNLDGKLDAAHEALADTRLQNDVAACNSLTAFIKAVEAQRGSRITDAQADQLIASAREIRVMLDCGD